MLKQSSRIRDFSVRIAGDEMGHLVRYLEVDLEGNLILGHCC
jgi:hypothetical protein